MPDEKNDHESVLTRIGSDAYKDMVLAEIDFVKALGSKNSLILASSNLGAFEVVLRLMQHREEGLPVYQAVKDVQSKFSSQSGILKRLNLMREAGLIESQPGKKASQVNLFLSEAFLADLAPVILRNKLK